MKNKYNKGGTPLQFIVIVIIIGVMSAMIVYFVSSSTVQSRDLRRKENIGQLVKAINMYFNIKGELPVKNVTCSTVSSSISNYKQNLKIALTPYISSIPVDPTLGGKSGDYVLSINSSSAGSYKICAKMEDKKMGNLRFTEDFSRNCPGGTTGYNYCVTQ